MENLFFYNKPTKKVRQEMVDFFGKQDRGVPAGAEVTRDSFVNCARNGGLQMSLIDAQLSYASHECNPVSLDNRGRCPYQKPCLELRLHEQQAAILQTEQTRIPEAALITAAFKGLPTGNR